MKKLLIILLFPFSLYSQPVHLSGAIMGFITKSGTKYIGDSTLQIATTITLTSNVTFDAGGGEYVGTGSVFISNGNAVNDSIMNLNGGSASQIFGQGTTITYTGIPSTALYYNVYTKNITLTHGTMLYNGTWDGPRTRHNLCIGLYSVGTIIKEDTARGNQVVWGNSIYQFTADGWNVTGSSKKGLVDNGVIQIESGNGVIKNSYRNGAMDGYWMRILGQAELSGLTGNQDSYIINTVDANTICYGTLDGRVDTSRLIKTGLITSRGGDIYFQNNTSANKSDYNVVNGKGGYVTNACIVGAMYGYTFHIDSCIAFNAQDRSDGMAANSSLVKDNSSGTAIISKHNNIDFPPTQLILLPYGLVDQNYYSLTPGIGAQAPVPVNICPIPKTVSYITITYSDSSTLKTKP